MSTASRLATSTASKTLRKDMEIQVILNEEWRKAKKSANSDSCAEVRRVADSIQVRDSKDPGGPTLTFTMKEWDAFLDGAKNNEFEI